MAYPPASVSVTSSEKNPIDERPFQSRVALENELALEAQYHELAIPEVVEAIRQVGSKQVRPPESDDRKG